MGKKIDIKKIENSTKCQVAFSKRRRSLIKKSHEISVMCDVDVLFLAFSPSGRLTKFCSRNRIEDVIERYIDLPVEKRYQQYHKSPMKNVEEKLEKLKMYDRVIKGDENKLQFLNNQLWRCARYGGLPPLRSRHLSLARVLMSSAKEKSSDTPGHMELQVKKSSVELELFEVNLRDYEPDPSFDPSLAQLLWCEKNLKQSLHRLNHKKRMFFNLPTTNEQMRVQKEHIERDVPLNNGANDQLNWVSQNLNSSQLGSQLNPWNISPSYRSSKVGVTNMVQELIGGQNGGNYGGNGALGVADNYMCNNNNQLPLIGYQSIQQSAGMPLLPPQPSVSTTYTTTYSPILQHQGSTAEEWNIVHPNQELGALAISAMATDHTSNQNMNMNTNLPLRSTISQLECEDFLNPNYIESNTNEKQLASDPTLIITNSIPPSDPDVDLLLPNCNISLEDLMGNDDKGTSSVAGNQEDDYSLEWDGFVLAENLINLDDLDFF